MATNPVSARMNQSLEAFRKEAVEAWEHYQSTGLHVTAAEADAWLAELEAGHDVEPPRARTALAL